jgi:mono/diheme cytochrome c family protein
MKTRILLSLCVVILLSMLLVACNQPPPLPDPPPTPIPTLVPATEPPPGAQNTPPPGVTLPTAPPDATAGLPVFAEHCASCHGADGKGDVEGSRDFTDVDYMRGAVPQEFFAVVTNGKGDMPAFKDELTDEERWNATWALWSFAVPAAEIAQGKTVYESAGCVSCHGADGQGVIPQARKFSPDFIPQHAVQEYYQSVSAGKGIMPAHQDRLSAEDRWASVEFVRTFGYEPASK